MYCSNASHKHGFLVTETQIINIKRAFRAWGSIPRTQKTHHVTLTFNF